MKLNILIATISGREKVFTDLIYDLENQRRMFKGQVEIVSIKDNRELSIGVKRQQMVEQSTGEYIAHIDDDDLISGNYVSKIMKALTSNPDCVGFNVRCDFPNGVFKAVVSNRYKEWENNKDGYDYVRSPNHLAVIKREHCLAAGFPDLRHGEDYVFSKKLVELGLLKNEVFINEELYTYRFNPNK